MEYSVAERIGTAGALGAAKDILGRQVPRILRRCSNRHGPAGMITFHNAKNSVCTIAMSTSVPIEYGVARVADDGRVTYFQEKPVLKEYPVSMGIHVLDKRSSLLLYPAHGPCRRHHPETRRRAETSVRIPDR